MRQHMQIYLECRSASPGKLRSERKYQGKLIEERMYQISKKETVVNLMLQIIYFAIRSAREFDAYSNTWC